MEVIHLHSKLAGYFRVQPVSCTELDVVIKSLSTSHCDLPDDTAISAQLIIKESIFLHTIPVKKDTSEWSWKVMVNCKIPTDVLHFSIAIIRVSRIAGNRLLGLVEATRGEILTLIEQKNSFSHLVKVNHNGPSLRLSASFTVSFPVPHLVLNQMDDVQNEFCSLNRDMIMPQLQHIWESTQSTQSRATEVDLLELSIMYEKILLLPSTDQNKPQFLNFLGDIYLKHYQISKGIIDLNQTVCIYHDAVQSGIDRGVMVASHMADLGISLLFRFEQLDDLNDINRSILMLEDAVQLTPDGHPHKPSYLNNLGSSFLCRFKRLGELSDINM